MPPTETVNRHQEKRGPDGVKPPFISSAARKLGATLKEWPVLGLFAGAFWFSILAIGVLIPSEDYRKALGWVPERSEKLLEQKELLDKVELLIKNNGAEGNPTSNVGTLSPVPQTSSAQTGTSVSEDNRLKKTPDLNDSEILICELCGQINGKNGDPCFSCVVGKRSIRPMILPFIISSLSFLPLNICLLTVLAALVGGCAINKGELRDLGRLVERHNVTGDFSPEADRDRKRYNYLCEHPGYSALRGLIVFLVIVSGLLLTGGTSIIFEGTQTEQLTQYFRMAGLFSFFGYLAGSDPTLFASIIEFGSARIRQAGGTNSTQAPAISKQSDPVTAVGAAAANAQITANAADDTLKAIEAIVPMVKEAKKPKSPKPENS